MYNEQRHLIFNGNSYHNILPPLSQSTQTESNKSSSFSTSSSTSASLVTFSDSSMVSSTSS